MWVLWTVTTALLYDKGPAVIGVHVAVPLPCQGKS